MASKPRTPGTQNLLRYVGKERVVSAKQLRRFAPSRMTLRRLADDGKVISIGAGLYASAALDPFVASIVAVARFYPGAVISNLTAMVIHELSDERIDRVDVDIERNSSIRNSLLKVHRVPEKRLIGITNIKFHGEKVSIYDVERCLSEAHRIDKGGPIFFKALKRYLKRQQPNTAAILKYDETLKTRVLHHVQQELADA